MVLCIYNQQLDCLSVTSKDVVIESALCVVEGSVVLISSCDLYIPSIVGTCWKKKVSSFVHISWCNWKIYFSKMLQFSWEVRVELFGMGLIWRCRKWVLIVKCLKTRKMRGSWIFFLFISGIFSFYASRKVELIFLNKMSMMLTACDSIVGRPPSKMQRCRCSE